MEMSLPGLLSSDPLAQPSAHTMALPQTGGAWVSHSGHQAGQMESGPFIVCNSSSFTTIHSIPR